MQHLTKSALLLSVALFALSGCGGTPEEKEARYLKKGDELMAQGKLKKARVEFRNAAKIKPTDANAYLSFRYRR